MKRDVGYLKYPNEPVFSFSISLEGNINKKNTKENKKEQDNFNAKYIPPLDKKALLKDKQKLILFLFLFLELRKLFWILLNSSLPKRAERHKGPL